MWVKKKFIENINNALKLYVSNHYITDSLGFEEFKAKKYQETVNLVNSFQKELNDRRKKLEDIEGFYQKSQEENKRLIEIKKSLEGKIEAGQGELLRSNSDLKTTLEILEASYRVSLKENREIREENGKLKVTNRRLEVENEDFIQKNSNLSELRETLKKENQELSASYRNIRADVAREFAELKLQQGELLKYNTDLEERLEKLLGSYHLSLQERQKSQKDNARLDKANRSLENKNKELLLEKNQLSELYKEFKKQNKKLADYHESSGNFFSVSWMKLGKLNEKLLAMIRDFREAVNNDSDKRRLEFVLQIERQSVRVKKFVDKILAESNGKMDSLSFDAEEIDLKKMLLELKTGDLDFILDKELELQIVEEDSAPGKIVADKFRLVWVLKCLLLNACANAEKGIVRCRIFRYQSDLAGLRQAIPMVGVEIYNTGSASLPSGHKVTLEASRGLYGIRNGQYDDSVLGLNMLRELVVVLGGELHLNSVQGKGNTYLLVLPVSIEWQTEKPEFDEDDSPLPGDEIFLVLEDDLSLVKSLGKSFKQNERKWLAASSAAEILELIDQYFARALFVGSQWHNNEGEELLNKIREKVLPRRVPVCALSNEERADLKWKNKFMGYLPNPDQHALTELILKRIEAYSQVQPLNVLTFFQEERPSPLINSVLNKIDAQPVFIKATKDLSLPNSSFDLFLLDFTQKEVPVFELFEFVEKIGKLADDSSVIVCLKKEPSYRERSFLSRNADIYLFAGGTLSESCLAEAILLADRRRSLPLDKRRKNFMDYVRVRDKIFLDKQCLMITDNSANSLQTIKFRKQLTSLGIELHVNVQGKSLLKTLDANRFLDLIIIYRLRSKTNMRDWIETVRRNKTSRDVPVMIVDDKAVYGDRQFWIAEGADEFLHGSVASQRLLSSIRVLMGSGFLDPDD